MCWWRLQGRLLTSSHSIATDGCGFDSRHLNQNFSILLIWLIISERHLHQFRRQLAWLTQNTHKVRFVMSCKYLVKRKNSSVYHYRIIAPTDLKSVLIQESLEISLSTGIHRIAQSRARKLNQFVQNLFQAYREGHMASLTMTIVKESQSKNSQRCIVMLN